MNNITRIVLMMMAVTSFTACTNHPGNNNSTAKDTVGNRYGADTTKVEKMNKDTAAITNKTGDASTLDNSGSGGTPKDTGVNQVKNK